MHPKRCVGSSHVTNMSKTPKRGHCTDLLPKFQAEQVPPSYYLLVACEYCNNFGAISGYRRICFDEWKHLRRPSKRCAAKRMSYRMMFFEICSVSLLGRIQLVLGMQRRESNHFLTNFGVTLSQFEVVLKLRAFQDGVS